MKTVTLTDLDNLHKANDLPGGSEFPIAARTCYMNFSQCATFTNPPALTTRMTRRLGTPRHIRPIPWIRWNLCPPPQTAIGPAALHHLGIMYAVDDFITAAPDARVAVVAVAVVLGWPSTRGLTVPEIADQLASARRRWAGLAPDSAKWPGSGFPPAAVFDSLATVQGQTATSGRRCGRRADGTDELSLGLAKNRRPGPPKNRLSIKTAKIRNTIFTVYLTPLLPQKKLFFAGTLPFVSPWD